MYKGPGILDRWYLNASATKHVYFKTHVAIIMCTYLTLTTHLSSLQEKGVYETDTSSLAAELDSYVSYRGREAFVFAPIICFFCSHCSATPKLK